MRLISGPRVTPIGIDIGSLSVKLVQFSADRSSLIDAARWELPGDLNVALTPAQRNERLVEALQRAREGRQFRGKEVVMCLSGRQLFLQNLRIPKSDPLATERAVYQEAAGRIPFPIVEAEIRYLETAEIRQGDQFVRELILMACHRPTLEEALKVIERAGFVPTAVDVEPVALLRCCGAQYRRDEDRQLRSLVAHIGYTSTLVMIAQGDEILFIKYLDLGGKHLDDAVARSLQMDSADATALRRHNGDRRSDRQDPEITRSIHEATRPVIDRLANELAMCLRYHSVTFRGQPVERLVVGGGEATPTLAETLHSRLNLRCELSDPFRAYQGAANRGRLGQWDIAAGLALRPPKAA